MRKYERGQVLPLVAILIFVLLGFAALAVDVGYNRYAKRIEQSAADSAALAGAMEKLTGSTNATASAKHDASKNGFTDSTPSGSTCTGTTCIDVNIPPASGSYTGDSTAVEVIVHKQFPTFFGRVFGSSSNTITSRAVARLRSDNNGCFFALDPAQNTNVNKSTINAPGCTIFVNGSANFNGVTTTASIDVAGDVGGNAPTYTQLSGPVSDPCLSIPGCAYLTANPPSASGCVPLSASATTAAPGCYSSFQPSGNVSLSPGLYIINGPMTINGTLSGSGVTLYFTSAANPIDASKGTLTFSAPTSGNYLNVAVYGAAVPNASANFNKANVNITGVFYMPNLCANFNKNTASYVVFIVACGNMNKNDLEMQAPPNGGSYIETPVLAE